MPSRPAGNAACIDAVDTTAGMGKGRVSGIGPAGSALEQQLRSRRRPNTTRTPTKTEARMSLSRSVRALARLIPLGLALSFASTTVHAGAPPGDLTADLVLGQADFVSGSANRGTPVQPGANSLNRPIAVAIDRSVFPNRLYVADFDNHRVLAWNSTVALTNGLPADRVFGQGGSFVTQARPFPPTADSFEGPAGLAVDAAGNLFVAEETNRRVLRFNAPFAAETTNGKGDTTADAVFGQTDFTTRTSGLTASSVAALGEIAIDAGANLYVSDWGNNRVLRFANASTAGNGTSATAVFGQPDFTTRTIGGPATASKFYYPFGVAVSTAGDLYVTDLFYYRALRFANAATASSGAAAVGVFGQPDFTTSTNGISATTMTNARALSVDEAGNLWVSDNSRVLRFDAAGTVTTPGPAASAVLGQGGSFDTNSQTTSAEGFRGVRGLEFDSVGNLYIADFDSHRVVRYDSAAPGLPTPPTDLVATPGNAIASISFTAPDGDISNYQYSTDDGASYTAFSPADDTSPVTITGLTGGVTYLVRLRAVGTYGAGAPSDAVSVTPIAAVAGTCGTAHDVATASAPAAQLCATGSAGPVTSTGGQWAWACNGTGGSVVNASCGAPFQTQTITLAANPTSIAVNGSSMVTASSTSGLAPTLSLAASTDCTLGEASGSVTVTASVSAVNAGGSCVVRADRAISPDGCTSCYQAADQATTTITLTKADQTISFGTAPTGLVVGGATGTVSATASSGLSVTFSNGMSMFCGVSGTTVTPLRAGTCTVLANQGGNANYNLAPQASQNITIGKGSQTITGFAANPASLVVGGGSAALSASGGDSGNALVYASSTPGICTVAGTTVTAVAAGTCTVTANQAGNADYNAAAAATLNLTIGKGSQSISGFASNPASLSVGGGSATLSATGGASGNAVTYSSSTTGICTVSGSTVTPVASGTCTVVANQAGNANYNAATAANLSITVGIGSQTISGFASSPMNLVVGGSNGAVSATGGASGNAVTYGSSTPGICSVSGNAVTALSAGTCTVVANQAGNANYGAAPAVALNLTVTRGSQSIGGLSASPSTLVVGGGTATLSATGGASGNAVTYSSTTEICTISGTTVTPVAAGTCTVVANQAGNGGYNAAPTASLTITIGQGSQSIGGFASSASSLLVNRGTATLTAIGGASGNAVQFASETPVVCTVSDSTVTAIAEGSCTVSASQAGNADYLAAPVQTLSITVSADSIEDTVPSSGDTGGLGDGNGDSIADSTQSEVASLPTLTGDSFATIASSSGRTLSRVTTVAVPDDFPADLRVPLSGVAFTLNETEASETVELYFPARDRVVGLRKRNRTTGVYDSLPVTVTRVGNRTRISFTLTDGGDYDADGLVNGSISDPVFPEVAAEAASGGGSAGWSSLLPLSLLALIRRRRRAAMHA